MLKKLILPGAIIFTVVIFSGNIFARFSSIPGYANSGIEKYSADDNSAAAVHENYYAALPTPAVYREDPDHGYARSAIRSESSSDNIKPIFSRNYLRNEDSEIAGSNGKGNSFDPYGNLASMQHPPVSSKTSTGVPPFGYITYKEKSYSPIRDFRTDMWTGKNIDNKPGITAAYNDYDDAEDRETDY